MSIQKIQAALETALKSIAPAIDTVYQNVSYQPKSGVPYQRVNLIPTDVANPAVGDALKRYEGFFQVMLCYPAGKGTKDAAERAEKIEQTFSYGKQFAHGGITVRVRSSPVIRQGFIDEDRWCVPIRVYYYADIN